MKVGTAKNIAAEWVMKHASKASGFQGAYFIGSTTEMSINADLPESSDIDIIVVTPLEEPPMKLGKFFYRGVLLEVTYLSWQQLSSAEEILSSYHLAGGFRKNTIITDPTGRLQRLQRDVSKHFADEKWVRKRCRNAGEKVERGLKNIDTSAPFYDQVMAWLFSTGVMTHVLLVAALCNPTVRLRYLAVRRVLTEYGHMDFYRDLLELLGCAYMTPQRVEAHLDELARTFDSTVEVAKTPFFFSTDISDISRPIAIDGSRKLIQSGYHHEAVFWVVATFARCHKILDVDAPRDLKDELAPAFKEMVADLGIISTDDIICRAEEGLEFLPKLWEVTEDILCSNEKII